MLLREIHQVVDSFLEARVTFGAPHQPQFKDVVMTSTLDRLITGIVREVIVFILLEQVGRIR